MSEIKGNQNGPDVPEQRPSRHQAPSLTIAKDKINNTNLQEQFVPDPALERFKEVKQQPLEIRKQSRKRPVSQEQRQYLGVVDEDLNGCIYEWLKLDIPLNKCATACFFKDIVIADMPNNNVGCYIRSTFTEIFKKNFFEQDCPYITAAYQLINQKKLFLTFSSGQVLIYPFDNEYLESQSNKNPQTA